MEGITNIEKTKEDLARCQAIVLEEIGMGVPENLRLELTKDIMDTALFIGGDFSDDNIRNLAKQYRDTGGIDRFLRKYQG